MDDALSQPVAVQGHGGIDAQPAEPYDEGTSVLLDDSVESPSHHVAVAVDGEGPGGKGTTALGAGAAGVGGGGVGSVEGSSATDTSTAAAASVASTSSSNPAASRTTATKDSATTGLSNPSLPLHPFHTPADEPGDSRTPTLTTAASHAIEGFVQPSSYLRRARAASKTMQQPVREETAIERDQKLALRSIRAFLKVRTSYDVLPISYRLIVFDTTLLVKKSLNILNQNGIVSAPLWDSKTSTFAGMLTTSDYINLIQYYWQNPDAMSRIDQFRLNSLRDIEKAIGVAPIETISVHPMRPLYEACRRLIEARARRIPIIDIDDDTGRAMVVSVLTQYRLLKFVAINTTETQLLKVPLKYLPGVGTYTRIASADMDTPVIKVIHMLVSKQISSVPILNTDGVVVNVFEAVDVITLIKGGNYDCLTLPVGEALSQRAPDFPGIFTCSLDDRLDSIFDTIRKSRVHRFIIIDDANRLKGILTLSDILKYILLEGETEDQT